MKLPRKLPGLVEAACLLALAGFLAYLLMAGNYWMYLNPRFQALSWAAAAVLAVLGAYSLARPPAGSTWMRAGLYVLVIVMCLASEVGVRRMLDRQGLDQAAQAEEAPLPSRVSKGGVEYVRINLGELFDIVGKEQRGKMGQDYAVRGFARRSPSLDAKGEFVLYRVALYCCYADSTAVGIRVRAPKGGALPENGAWVVAYGRLEPSPLEGTDAQDAFGGAAFASVEPTHALAARLLEPEKAPGTGMMYEWRSEEPYAF